MQMNLNINSVLAEELTGTPSTPGYALALGLANDSQIDSQTLEMVGALASRDGDKWVEVIRRLSKHNLPLVLQAYGQRVDLYRGFM